MSALGLLAPRRLGRLIASDAANVGRDPLLLAVVVLSALPALAFWFWADAMDRAAFAAFGLVGLSRYVAAVALLIPAILIGWVGGFLLLEDRDDGIMPALAVTQAGKAGFLAYRMAAVALLTAMLTLAGMPVLVPQASLALSLVLLVLIAATAVLCAMILPAIARNKVEGLALTKLTNLLAIAPLLAIIPSPWRYLASMVPTFWIGELLALSPRASMPMPAATAAAIGMSGICGVVLLRRFVRRVG